MTRIGILLVCALLLSTTVVLVAPGASANCISQVKGLCIQCPYGYPGQGCIVTNPCDPRYCRPNLP